jgi:hypothetical protein
MKVIFADHSVLKPEEFFTHCFPYSFFDETTFATNYTYQKNNPQEPECH